MTNAKVILMFRNAPHAPLSVCVCAYGLFNMTIGMSHQYAIQLYMYACDFTKYSNEFLGR